MRWAAIGWCMAVAGALAAATGKTPEDAVKALELSEGFSASLVAPEPLVVQPVAFEFDDRGRLWVAEFLSYPKWKPEGHDRIVLLEATHGDGRMDKRTVIWDSGNYLTSFALGWGGIWVTTPPNMLFIPCDFDAEHPQCGTAQVKLDGWSHAGTHNVVSNLSWGPDGWLYGCNGISSRSRVGVPGCAESERVFIDGGVWRYRPGTGALEQVCTGMTNPWGLDWDAQGELFATNNVTAHLYHVVPGARFDRSHESDRNPYTYELMGGIADHLHYAGGKWQDSRGGLGKHGELGGGHSHVGAFICRGNELGEQYRNSIFMFNTHGNRINRDVLEQTSTGYVARHAPDFCLAHDTSFRGVSLKIGPDGALYLSDWHQDGECHSGSEIDSGRIFKIALAGKKIAVLNLAGLSDSELAKLIADGAPRWQSEHAARMLAERALTGRREPPPIAPVDIEKRWLDCAKAGAERLKLASLLSRNTWTQTETKDVLKGILSRGDEVWGRNLECMVWYAIEPHVESDPAWALGLLRSAALHQRVILAVCIARRLAEHRLDALVEGAALAPQPIEFRLAVLQGIDAALKGQAHRAEPPAWHRFAVQCSEAGERERVRHISAVFGDAVSLDELRQIAADKGAQILQRRNALESLLNANDPGLVPLLRKLVRDLDMRLDALKALARFDDPQTAGMILQLYPNFDPGEKSAALATLAGRESTAAALFAALKNSGVPVRDLDATVVRELQAYGLIDLNAWIEKNWGVSRVSAEDKQLEIARLKKIVEVNTRNADAARGQALFRKTCSNCHTLFGEGGKVGPDLTGSARANLDYLLTNIVDPNAIVPQEYMAWTIKLKDGRVLNGLVRNENAETLEVVAATERVTLKLDEIQIKKRSTLSMMPEGVLNALSAGEIGDLIAYLQSK